MEAVAPKVADVDVVNREDHTLAEAVVMDVDIMVEVWAVVLVGVRLHMMMASLSLMMY
jgi:hypothetical protein